MNFFLHSSENLSMKQKADVQRVDNALDKINHYPVDSVVCFIDTYPLNSNLSNA